MASAATYTATATGEAIGQQGNVSRTRVQLRQREQKQVIWNDAVVDNEGMGKRKSKKCCIYHKPKRFDESSSSESDDSREGESGAAGFPGIGLPKDEVEPDVGVAPSDIVDVGGDADGCIHSCLTGPSSCVQRQSSAACVARKDCAHCAAVAAQISAEELHLRTVVSSPEATEATSMVRDALDLFEAQEKGGASSAILGSVAGSATDNL